MNTNNESAKIGKAIALTNNPDLVESQLEVMKVQVKEVLEGVANAQEETQVSNSTSKPVYAHFDSELMALSNNPDLVESHLQKTRGGF